MPNDNPTIIVPGILGSTLEDFFSIEPRATWSEWESIATALTGPDVFSLALDPSGAFDGSLQVMTRANGLIPAAYERLASALRGRRSAPVYVFPYDWRYSTATAGALLGAFVERVRAKMAAALRGWDGRVDFVTHSLGGLVFRAYLSSNPPPSHLGQVVFMAVPQRGSLDAVEAMIRGKSLLFGGRKEMRKLARSFPSVYELLPTFERAVVDSAGQELNVFDLRYWQENVTPYGPDGEEVHGLDVVQARLDAAARQQQAFRNPTDVVEARNILTLYAVQRGSTLEQVRVGPQSGLDHWYDFDRARLGDGDGVVLARSAVLPGVAAIRLTTSDVSFFTEASARFVSLHAFIATLDEAQTIVSRFLAGERRPAELLPRSLPLDRYEGA